MLGAKLDWPQSVASTANFRPPRGSARAPRLAASPERQWACVTWPINLSPWYFWLLARYLTPDERRLFRGVSNNANAPQWWVSFRFEPIECQYKRANVSSVIANGTRIRTMNVLWLLFLCNFHVIEFHHASGVLIGVDSMEDRMFWFQSQPTIIYIANWRPTTSETPWGRLVVCFGKKQFPLSFVRLPLYPTSTTTTTTTTFQPERGRARERAVPLNLIQLRFSLKD